MMNGGAYLNVWEAAASDSKKTVYYVVRHPWEWVMESLAEGTKMISVETDSDLPLAKQQAEQEAVNAAAMDANSSSSNSPMAGRRSRRTARGRPKGSQGRPSLRFEVVDDTTGQVEMAVHGTSVSFEGLGDKDELVRTMHRCRCEELELTPPSILIQWDMNKDEVFNVIKETLPRIKGAPDNAVALLKEPMGSRGQGIYFVRDAQEIYEIIDRNHKKMSEDPTYLDKLIAKKGRIPCWVLQAEVAPAMLIRDRRKFHIRSYVVVLERMDDEILDMLIYSRHEVRIAGVPVKENEGKERDPLAHITNGALSDGTDRCMLDEVPEFIELNLQAKVELFVAEVFGMYLLQDISRRIPPPQQHATGVGGVPIREFAVAGLDLMVTQDKRIYLLEVNVNPWAPRQSLCDEQFSQHLKGFFKDLVNLVTMGVQYQSNFRDAFEILERHASAL